MQETINKEDVLEAVDKIAKTALQRCENLLNQINSNKAEDKDDEIISETN
ncbi:MAG: hypothetical protein QW727_02400 [Candidatus Pacearchaeota archaeon]